MNLATHLRILLRACRISDYELALKSGISKSGISKILSGKTKTPALNTLDAIATVLGVSTQSLLDYLPLYSRSPNPIQATPNSLRPMIPVFTLIQANKINTLSIETRRKKAIDFIPTAFDSETTFAIRLDTDTPPFLNQYTLTITPYISPKTGDYVLIQTTELEAALGRLCAEPKPIITSLNPHKDHWILPLKTLKDPRLLGVVQEAYWKNI